MQILAIGGPYASAPVNAPTSLSAIPTNTTVAISFTAPTNNGGAPITNYEYSFNGSSWTAFSPEDAISPVTISGLTQNTGYTVYLRAVNIVGSGPASTGVSFTTEGVPTGTATITSISTGQTTATVNFTVAAGGGAITGYDLYVANFTNAWNNTTASPISVTGLTGNSTYTFYVRAKNAYGVGPQSAGVNATTLPVFISASGGTTFDYVSGGNTFRSHTFTSNGTFTVSTVGSFGLVDVHLVGGGGGGGWSFGAGGGGGGARTQASVSVSATSYGIVIGGAGSQIKNQYTGGDGGTSSGLGYSVGGGGGGSSNVSGPGAPANGSGGGGNINGIAAGAGSSYGSAGGAGIAGQGGGVGGSGYNQPNAYRTGSNETYAIGGYGSLANGYGAPAGGTTRGCGGGGGGNYSQVDYYGGASVGGTVIIRYRIA